MVQPIQHIAKQDDLQQCDKQFTNQDQLPPSNLTVGRQEGVLSLSYLLHQGAMPYKATALPCTGNHQPVSFPPQAFCTKKPDAYSETGITL